MAGIIIGLQSCLHTGNKKLLSSAEAMMNESPDSASAILKSMDLGKISNNADKAWYALLLTQARHKCYIDETNDSLINIAIRYYEHSSDRFRYMQSCFYKANILYNVQNFASAIIDATKANEIAKELKDDYWIAKSAEQIAFIYNETHYNREAIKFSSEAVNYYKKAGKEISHLYSLCDLAIDYANIDSLQRSMSILDSIMRLPSTTMYSTMLGYCYKTIGNVFIKMRNYEKAKEYYVDSPDSLKYVMKQDRYYYTDLAGIYLALGDNLSAEKYINTAKYMAKTSTDTAVVYCVMSSYYEENGMYKEANQYKDSAMVLHNKVVNDILQQSVITSQRDYYNALSQKTEEHAHHLQNIIFAGIFTMICVCVLGCWFYRLNIKIKNNEMEKRMNEILVLSEKIKSDNMEKSKLVNQLQAQQNKSKSLKMLVENMFKDRWETINKLCDEYFEKGDSEATKVTIVNDVEREIKRICNAGNMKNIEAAVNDYMDDIISKIRIQCSFLKPEDVMFITLLYAGFSPRAVCLFTGFKLKSFYTKRSRLREKILNSDAPDKVLFVEKMG